MFSARELWTDVCSAWITGWVHLSEHSKVVHTPKLEWIPNMMVLNMYLLSNIAMFGIYVEIRGWMCFSPNNMWPNLWCKTDPSVFFSWKNKIPFLVAALLLPADPTSVLGTVIDWMWWKCRIQTTASAEATRLAEDKAWGWGLTKGCIFWFWWHAKRMFPKWVLKIQQHVITCICISEDSFSISRWYVGAYIF